MKPVGLKLLAYLLSFHLMALKGIAQMDYDDIKPFQKEIAFNEQFLTVSNSWRLEKKSEIADGKLVIDAGNIGPAGITTTRSAFSNLEFDETRDYELELSLEYNPIKQGVFSIIFGGKYEWQMGATASSGLGNTTKKSFLGFEVSEMKADNTECSLSGGKKSYQITYKATNFKFRDAPSKKFTIRKIGKNIYFFIDGINVGYIPSQTTLRKEIGFCARAQDIRIDYITFSYIQKDISPATIFADNRSGSKSDGAGTYSLTKPGKYFSLIIGVSDYIDPKLQLDNPVNDAVKFKEILVSRYAFPDSNMFLVLNPTRQKIISEIFRLRKLVTQDDNLLIFFAGHGYWDNEAKQGYWWPKDASTEDPANWLSNSDLREQIRSIKSAHTLLISDACFSGGIFKTRGGNDLMNAPKDIQMLYRLPSRRAMTSGTMTTVPDKSVFLEFLCKRLLENKEKFLSSQQLFDSFRSAVMNNTNAVPQDGVIAETGDEGGDFIFILKDQ